MRFGPCRYKENDENEKLTYMYRHKENVYKYIDPFTPKSATYRFYSNARRFYSSMGNPTGVKGLKSIRI